MKPGNFTIKSSQVLGPFPSSFVDPSICIYSINYYIYFNDYMKNIIRQADNESSIKHIWYMTFLLVIIKIFIYFIGILILKN